jgi:hypothetical protein
MRDDRSGCLRRCGTPHQRPWPIPSAWTCWVATNPRHATAKRATHGPPHAIEWSPDANFCRSPALPGLAVRRVVAKRASRRLPRGFLPRRARLGSQVPRDSRYRQSARRYMQRLSARPHHVGSPYDKDNAEWILAKFKEWGLDAHIETFEVLFPTPKERALELVAPSVSPPNSPSRRSPAIPLPRSTTSSCPPTTPIPSMATSRRRWSTSTTACRKTTSTLDRLGISVKGAIVIARYGGSWRGIKPKVAAEHGAIGCIIYSDPQGRRLLGGRSLPARSLPPEGRRAARQRHGYAVFIPATR